MTGPYIIAEGGSCHEEQIERALGLTRVAANAGATAIKWQFWSDPARMRQRRHIDGDKAFEAGSIKESWLPDLRNAAHDLSLEFIVSAFLPEDVPLLAQYVDAFKVASFENKNEALLLAVDAASRETGRRVFISSGLTHISQWRHLLRDWHDSVIRLHCVTAYPCPPEEANLHMIERGQGYSDHTRVVFAGGLAVAAGADYLEVHCRLDDTAPSCPDYPHSLTPSELASYVDFAQTAWRLRGSGVRGPIACELPNQRYGVGAEEK